MKPVNWEQKKIESDRLWKEIHRRIGKMDRGLSPAEEEENLRDLWRCRALELSRVYEQEEEKGFRIKLVVFRLGSERYGVRITWVREIQKVGHIAVVPTAPAFVVGVINLRGNILSVIDIKVFFGLEQVVMNEHTRVLVVERGGMSIGILVEEVDEIVDIATADIKPPLSPAKGVTEEHVLGIAPHGGGMLLLLDVEKILKNPRIIVDEIV